VHTTPNGISYSTRRCIRHQTGFFTAQDGAYGTERNFLQHKTVHMTPNGILYPHQMGTPTDMKWVCLHQTGLVISPNGSLPKLNENVTNIETRRYELYLFDQNPRTKELSASVRSPKDRRTESETLCLIFTCFRLLGRSRSVLAFQSGLLSFGIYHNQTHRRDGVRKSNPFSSKFRLVYFTLYSKVPIHSVHEP
jgi:hypothetical protein